MSNPHRLVICALTMSTTGTMGGNSKITLELARFASQRGIEVHFILQPGSAAGAQEALGDDAARIHWHITASLPPIVRHPFLSLQVAYREICSVFEALKIGATDDVFCCSDFHYEVFPVWCLKKKFNFFWIASFFLFLPGPIENLFRCYRFPLLKYILVFFYQRAIFWCLCIRAGAFMITNDVDIRHFPTRFRGRVFAMYGGVNINQIPAGVVSKTRDVVFCSRLHPQKGINGFLDIWREVVVHCPDCHLTVIGNGAPDYEVALHQKAERLGVADSIDWLGYVNNEAKYRIYAQTRVFVHPTIYDNNGMVAAEALCTGLPVVMFDLPELREVYSVGCAKAPRGDKQAFADILIRLLTDSAYYESVRPSSEQVAALRARWDWQSRMECFLRFLHEKRGTAELEGAR